MKPKINPDPKIAAAARSTAEIILITAAAKAAVSKCLNATKVPRKPLPPMSGLTRFLITGDAAFGLKMNAQALFALGEGLEKFVGGKKPTDRRKEEEPAPKPQAEEKPAAPIAEEPIIEEPIIEEPIAGTAAAEPEPVAEEPSETPVAEEAVETVAVAEPEEAAPIAEEEPAEAAKEEPTETAEVVETAVEPEPSETEAEPVAEAETPLDAEEPAAEEEPIPEAEEAPAEAAEAEETEETTEEISEEIPAEEEATEAAEAVETAEEAPAAEEPENEPTAEETTEAGIAAEEAPAAEETTEAEEAPSEEAFIAEEPAVEAMAPVAVAAAGEETEDDAFGGNLEYIDVKDEPEAYAALLAQAEAGEIGLATRYRQSYESRLILSKDPMQDYYSGIKNALLAYKGVKSRISWANEKFHQGRNHIAKIIVKTSSLYLYLALDPAQLAGTKYESAVSVLSGRKKFETTPVLLKIKGERKYKYALELIEMVCGEAGLALPPNKKFAETDYRRPPMTMEEMVENGLVRMLVAATPKTEDSSN